MRPHPLSGQELLAQQTGARNVLAHLLRAVAALGVSYWISRWFTNAFYDQGVLGVSRVVIETGVHLLIAALALTLSSVIPIRRDLEGIARVVNEHEQALREQSRSQQFLQDVHGAFEMAEHEHELYEVTAVALEQAGSGRSEILVADASRAHVDRAVVAVGRAAPGCGVTTPGSCPAVRRGQTLVFAEPNGLAACPRLRERGLPDRAAATCAPITILGASTAVLHTVYDDVPADSALDDVTTQLEGVAVQFGARLGMLRAMAQSQLQADTDPLTGLLNRRAMENRIRQMRTEGTNFALAMVDLDHFKHLNDTFGHDTGDRALRLFARVMSNTVRDSDIVARHGGEEFVIVLPGADVVAAAPVLHRIRTTLEESIGSAQVPPFTVSMGLVDSTWSDDLVSLLRSADRALLHAKATGRDRIVIDDPVSSPHAIAEADVATAG